MKGIITADWHIRRQRPRCRLDEDWIGTQRKVLEAIVAQANHHNVDIYVIGDIFHTSNQTAEIVNMVIDILLCANNRVYLLAGQHDLPYHSYENEKRSSFGTLERRFLSMELLNTEKISAMHFGPDPENKEIIFTHQLVFYDEKVQPFEGIGKTAWELLQEYPAAKWIFTGDQHHGFHYQRDGRHVINPGCITIQAADLIDYEPSVYFVDTENEEVEPLSLPCASDLVTDEYIKDEKERNDRIEAFVSMVKNKGKVGLDFVDNLKKKIAEAGLKAETKKVMDETINELEV